MSKDLSILLRKITEYHKDNFRKSVNIKGEISNVESANKFQICSYDNNVFFDCISKDDYDISKGDQVEISGFLTIDSSNGIKYLINADTIYTVTTGSNLRKAIKLYDKIRANLNTEKPMRVVNKIKSKTIPKMIYNVGIIVPPENEDNLNNFKILFGEKCVGRLYVFNTCTHLVNFAQKALDHFNTYYDIDIIILLTNKVSSLQSLQLSTSANIKYMINTSIKPYIISVISADNNISYVPLTQIVSNMSIVGISDTIDFISKIQSNFLLRLNNNIVKCKSSLNTIFDELKQKSLCLNLDIISINSDIDGQMLTHKLATLKSCLVNRIYLEKIKLLEYNTFITSNLLSDQRINYVITKVIEQEKKLFTNHNSNPAPNNLIDYSINQQSTEKIENKLSDNTNADTNDYIYYDDNNGGYNGDF